MSGAIWRSSGTNESSATPHYWRPNRFESQLKPETRTITIIFSNSPVDLHHRHIFHPYTYRTFFKCTSHKNGCHPPVQHHRRAKCRYAPFTIAHLTAFCTNNAAKMRHSIKPDSIILLKRHLTRIGMMIKNKMNSILPSPNDDQKPIHQH